MKVVSIVGARPQFVKAAPVSRELQRKHQEVLLHTGQHYDYGMSQDYSTLTAARSPVLEMLRVRAGAYLLATLHRPHNTDDPARLQAILEAFEIVGEPIIFTAYPRTREAMFQQAQRVPPNVHLIEPVGYLDMVRLERQARAILTDSGGVQKEAHLLEVPCVTLREETEWVETVQAGWHRLVGADRDRIVAALGDLQVPVEHPLLFGNGHAAEKIVTLLDSE